MEIKMADIKALNKSTGAGMMDCKKALMEANGDLAGAEKILKEKGLAAMAKRTDRATAEGCVFIKQDGNKVVMLGLTCETDFVSKNEDFIAMGNKLVDLTIANGYTQVEQAHKDALNELSIKVRENMNISKLDVIEVPQDAAVATYIHSDKKTGSVVVVKGCSCDAVKQFAYDCCLHLAAFTPEYLTSKDVPEAYINEQKEIFQAQMNADEKMASKPENVKAGILQGKINKHVAEICFESQMFVKDDKKTVAQKIEEVGKENGKSLSFGDIKLCVLGK